MSKGDTGGFCGETEEFRYFDVDLQMRQIIINADDFGADVYRNQGIAEAVDAGVVTSVSVLVNGPAFDDALARLPVWQGRGVSVGLHVNLSEGDPVCKELAVLPDEHGCFRGKSSTHKLLMQVGNQELEREVALEIEAQIELLESTGVRISHLDGHQHVHIFPAAIAAAVQAAQRHGIAWLRIPEEPATIPSALRKEEFPGAGKLRCDELARGRILSFRETPSPSRGGLGWGWVLFNYCRFLPHPPPDLPLEGGGNKLHFASSSRRNSMVKRRSRYKVQQTMLLRREAAMFSLLAAAARPILNGSGVRTTDHFRGLYLKGRLSLPLLEELLNDLPAGLTELMVHPGRAPAGPSQGPFAAFSTVDREGELYVLLDSKLLNILKEKTVSLTPFPEARA